MMLKIVIQLQDSVDEYHTRMTEYIQVYTNNINY